jgi:murein DD-endopeptidase MepM/ murein hydrolase activator NlpD
MPARRPSTATAVLVAVTAVAGALGVVAPVTSHAQDTTGATTRTAPAAQALLVVDTGERTAAALRANRSDRSRPADREPGRQARALSDKTLSRFGAAELAAQLDRIERREARLEAAREAARKAREAARRARERQEHLDRWVMPIRSYTWSAGFGEAGSVWSSGYHTGQDWTASYGTPVYAAARGTISFAGWSDAYGNKLVITHYDGSQSWYAHLDGFERTGGSVAAGDLVGYVGCTGNCYGPHLHYEIHLSDGSDTDPVDWLRRHDVSL